MRPSLALSLVAALAVAMGACDLTGDARASDIGTGDSDEASDDGVPIDPSGQPGAACAIDDDCRPAAATCCECPTFAVAADDPLYQACLNVECPAGPQCSASSAVCDQGRCGLACEPLACNVSFATGFATDAAGCLVCEPAVAIGDDCTADAGCVQTRADCCGCANGGADTAVAASELGGFDDGLGCADSDPCPGVSVCEAEAAPRCVQGSCALLRGETPPAACGRSDLPGCPAGQACVLNLDGDATVRGLGICTPT